jgi:hypothetical protein
MQKYLWPAAALSVAMSAGMFLYAKHAIEHPESILMRYGVASLLSGLNINPLSDPKPMVQVAMVQKTAEPPCATDTVISKPSVDESIEPIQIETAPVAPATTAEPPVAMPEMTEELGTLFTSEPEQEGPKPMPYADEDETGEQGPRPKLSWRYKIERDESWEGHLSGNFNYEGLDGSDGSGGSIVKLAQQIAAAVGGMCWTPFDLPALDANAGDEDTNFHQIHQGCPYSGACPYNQQSAPAMVIPWTDAVRFPLFPIGPY